MDSIDVYHDGSSLHFDILLGDTALRQHISEALKDALHNADRSDAGSWVPLREMLYDVEAGADTLRTYGRHAFYLRDALLAYGEGIGREIGERAKTAMLKLLEERGETLRVRKGVQ